MLCLVSLKTEPSSVFSTKEDQSYYTSHFVGEWGDQLALIIIDADVEIYSDMCSYVCPSYNKLPFPDLSGISTYNQEKLEN